MIHKSFNFNRLLKGGIHKRIAAFLHFEAEKLNLTASPGNYNGILIDFTHFVDNVTQNTLPLCKIHTDCSRFRSVYFVVQWILSYAMKMTIFKLSIPGIKVKIICFNT